MPADLIINADDFGRSASINRAIIRAHREGVLNSASLMVAGEAFEEAVELACQNPDLRIGLHVVAMDGPAVLPHALIP
ncbi:MAG TPA: ChbG/HpnK family deacetylase, partial [Tepidisphaeraceae bacterium]|nr:ChbG/HpnK family deacetylase [Tepidisphaeraceae bacterium]